MVFFSKSRSTYPDLIFWSSPAGRRKIRGRPLTVWRRLSCVSLSVPGRTCCAFPWPETNVSWKLQTTTKLLSTSKKRRVVRPLSNVTPFRVFLLFAVSWRASPWHAVWCGTTNGETRIQGSAWKYIPVLSLRFTFILLKDLHIRYV